MDDLCLPNNSGNGSIDKINIIYNIWQNVTQMDAFG